MTADTKGFRWGIERRLEFIEFRLYWEGGVNRSDIVEEFGVSVPQASKDLTLYQEQAPQNIQYNRSQKRYFATDDFCPRFITLDADAYLERLTTNALSESAAEPWGITALKAERLPIPQRQIIADVLRALLSCVRGNRSIEILYQSMNPARPDPEWRRITPHAFGSDGLRWHVRALCHIDRKFKDFIVSRCLDTRSIGEPGELSSDDPFWTGHFTVSLCPNPQLSPNQQKIVAQDFAMTDGEIAVPVRRALLYYFSKRLRLDVADRFDDPREAPVVIKNRDAFDIALADVMR